VRYRTAAVVSAVRVAVTAGMYSLPAAVWAVFLPSLKQGLPDPIPVYEKIRLEVALFCGSWQWMLALLALPIVVVLFTVAEFTSVARVRNLKTATPPPTSRPPSLWNPNAAAGWESPFFSSIRSTVRGWQFRRLQRQSSFADGNRLEFELTFDRFRIADIITGEKSRFHSWSAES
jgi:hypothetical protein